MKKVLLGSIPILAVLAIMVNFVVDKPDVAHAVRSFTVTKVNPVPGFQNGEDVDTDWGNFGTVFTVTYSDTDFAGQGVGDLRSFRIDSDELDTVVNFTDIVETADTGTWEIEFLVKDGGAAVSPVAGTADGGELPVDDEDIVTVGARATIVGANQRIVEIDIENNLPNIRSLSPDDEDVVDDEDIDFTVSVDDSDSGIPDPEDVSDWGDGDDEYTSIFFLVSDAQCTNDELDLEAADMELFDVECDGVDVDLIEIADDGDFDDITNGFEVDTRITVAGDGVYFVTVLAFDAAGNFRILDVDRTDDDRMMAEITVDTGDPDLVLALTGWTWDNGDDAYDDDRTYIALFFNDLSDLDPDSIDPDDFIVQGHDVRRVQWFDVDPEDVDVDSIPEAVALEGVEGDVVPGDVIRRVVFLQLDDELDPDEGPDVNIVPDGVDDEAGNTQDDDEEEAVDGIAPEFTVLEFTGPIANKLLAGEDDEMEMIITSDENLDDDPDVTVTFVNVPAGCDKTVSDEGGPAGDIDDDGNPDCIFADGSRSAEVDEIGNNRWRVTIPDPQETGWYSIYITGTDDQGNVGDEGVAPADLMGDFFDSTGDVDDDVIAFEGDVAMPDPLVRIAGEADPGEYEDGVEFRNPFFIEINFEDPAFDADDNPEGDEFDPLDEDTEYEEDNFDDVEITLFELDGVDLTDQVSTTNSRRFLIAIENIALGDHNIAVQARDEAGNELDDELDIDFFVEERATFDLEVAPGWNLSSVPGRPDDPDINAVFGPGVPVTTVYTFDPSVPGGWLVAVRDNPEDAWVGDLTQITEDRGYWVLANQIVEINIDVPRIAGGSANGGTPIQPPVIDLFPGWNLIPVADVTGEAEFEDEIDADDYFASAVNTQGGVSISRVLTFNTITNQWEAIQTGLGAGAPAPGVLEFGHAYWVFSNEEFTLVPGGAIN